MNPLIFVILIIMILFTAYHFWTDIRNAWNTGETFAEGMTSGADPKNNVQYKCIGKYGGAAGSFNTYDATTLTQAQKSQVVAVYGDEAKEENRGAAYYACKQGCEDLNNGTCQATTTPSSMAKFATSAAAAAPEYKGSWEDKPTALWTPAQGDWKYVSAGPPKTDTDASFDKCKAACAQDQTCKGFEWNVKYDDNCALITKFSGTGGGGSQRFRVISKDGKIVPDPQYNGSYKSGIKVVNLQYGDTIQLNNMYMPVKQNDFGFLYFFGNMASGYKASTTRVSSHAGTKWKIMGVGGENDVGKPVMKGQTVLLFSPVNRRYLAQNVNEVFCSTGMRGTMKETPDNTCQFIIEESGGGSNIKTNSQISLKSKNNNQYLITCNWQNQPNLELQVGTRKDSDPNGGVWQIIPVDAKGFTTAYSNISDNSAPSGGIILDQGLNNAYASGTQIVPGENTVVTTDDQGNTITTTTSQSSSVDPTTGAKTEKKCISVSELSSAAAWVDKLFGTLSDTKCADKSKVEAAKTASKMDFISGVIKGYQNDRDGSNKYYMDAIAKATPHLNQAFSGNNMAQGTGGMFGSAVNGNSNNLAQGTTESISNNTAQTQAPVTNNIQAPQPPTWQAQQMAQQFQQQGQQQQTINGQVLPNGFVVQPGSGKCPNGCKYPQYDNKGCEDTILNGKSYRKCPWVKDGLNGSDCAECGAILMPKNKFGYARTRPGLFDNISINMAIENAGASKKGDYYNIGKKFMKQLSQIKNFNLPDTINTNEYVSVGKMVHKYQTEETDSSKTLLTDFINQLLTTSNMSANGKVNNNSLISEQVNKMGGNFDIDQKKLTLKGAYAYDEGKKEVADDNRLGGSNNMYEKQISEKIRRLNGIPRDPKKRPNPYDSVWDIFKY